MLVLNINSCSPKFVSINTNNKVQNYVIKDKITFSGELPHIKPISFQLNFHLDKVNEEVQKQCAKKGWNNDSPELAHWLFGKSKKFDADTIQINNIDYAHALITYTCGIVERQLRRTLIKKSPLECVEQSKMYGDSLKRLSNIYEAKFDLEPKKIVFMEIAHDLVKKAFDFYATKRLSKEPSYTQSNSHRLHLNVNVPSKDLIENYKKGKLTGAQPEFYQERYNKKDYNEELLKLCLSFKEVEEGCHNTYSKSLLADMANLYEMVGNHEKANLCVEYSKKIIEVKQEPELFYRKSSEEDSKKRKNPILRLKSKIQDEIKILLYTLKHIDKAEKKFDKKQQLQWADSLVPHTRDINDVSEAETYITESCKTLKQQLNEIKSKKSDKFTKKAKAYSQFLIILSNVQRAKYAFYPEQPELLKEAYQTAKKACEIKEKYL